MKCTGFRRSQWLLAVTAAGVAPCLFAQERTLEDRLRALERQNQELRSELDSQRQTIADLKSRLPSSETSEKAEMPASGGFNFGKIHLSAEGGVSYLDTTTAKSASPAGEFRVDEAKVFLEAPIWKNVYFFSEWDLVIHEANDEFFHLGELYLDVENVLKYWTDQEYLSLRVGRIDIPFGEEYLVRDAIDNPLISHSLTDFWGVDEGVELYGKAFGFDYVFAVQNGGHPTLHDYDSDKAFSGRIGYNIGKHARLSFSGIRTGDLSSEKDKFSELWFGGGFFRSLSFTGDTFQVQAYEGDGQIYWDSGHLKLAGGYFKYDDDDQFVENARDGYFYSAEAMQRLTSKLYAAGRFSQILPEKGMPIIGFGNFGDYLFGPLTENLWRLSLGLGYRWSENFITKVEYSHENGKLTSGARRDIDFFGAELAFKF